MSLSWTPPTPRRPLTRNPRVTRADSELQERASLVSPPQAGRGEPLSSRETFLSLDSRQVQEAPARQVFFANTIIFPGQPCVIASEARQSRSHENKRVFHPRGSAEGRCQTRNDGKPWLRDGHLVARYP